MNVTVNECLDKMSNLVLGDPEAQALSALSSFQDGSDTPNILNGASFECYESSDSEGIQSAPELSESQRKSENARLYPLEVKLYWTYEEVERGAMKKKRKRCVDVYNGITAKRRKCIKEWAELAKCNQSNENNQQKTPTKKEIGYDADDEY